MSWHLHDGTEAMYQDPMGRRTPCRVLRVYNRMVLVEWHSGKTATRVSCRRIVRPTYAEVLEIWPDRLHYYEVSGVDAKDGGAA